MNCSGGLNKDISPSSVENVEVQVDLVFGNLCEYIGHLFTLSSVRTCSSKDFLASGSCKKHYKIQNNILNIDYILSCLSFK